MEHKEFLHRTGHKLAVGVIGMGYTVNYGPAKARQRKRRIRLRMPLAVLGLVLSVLLARYIWPGETERLRQALFPWTRESVQEAFTGFQDDIGKGKPFADAITAFCLEIVDEADLTQ